VPCSRDPSLGARDDTSAFNFDLIRPQNKALFSCFLATKQCKQLTISINHNEHGTLPKLFLRYFNSGIASPLTLSLCLQGFDENKGAASAVQYTDVFCRDSSTHLQFCRAIPFLRIGVYFCGGKSGDVRDLCVGISLKFILTQQDLLRR
jgi:hypothetical protein